MKKSLVFMLFVSLLLSVVSFTSCGGKDNRAPGAEEGSKDKDKDKDKDGSKGQSEGARPQDSDAARRAKQDEEDRRWFSDYIGGSDVGGVRRLAVGTIIEYDGVGVGDPGTDSKAILCFKITDSKGGTEKYRTTPCPYWHLDLAVEFFVDYKIRREGKAVVICNKDDGGELIRLEGVGKKAIFQRNNVFVAV